MRTSKHIGIVGCSAPGAALCYQTICSNDKENPFSHPEVSMHTPPLSEYVVALQKENWTVVSQLMLESARKLKMLGCDFVICPDNTIHAAFLHTNLEQQLPLPWLHIAQVVADEASRKQFNRVGLLGTKWLVGSDVYHQKLKEKSIQCIRPNPTEIEVVNNLIMTELTHAIITPTALHKFQEIISRMKQQGAQAVILGCTEIPLLVNDTNSPLPTLDSTRLLACAAFERAKHK